VKRELHKAIPYEVFTNNADFLGWQNRQMCKIGITLHTLICQASKQTDSPNTHIPELFQEID
jgi:hypothetical protein